ncbi:MAG: DASS family sodium-coupled anion symporter [Defluviitaleaceae bacterium]|nr:DASS family sodium-coupled anion symporter [Defluviitaleaceae bacterium]
MTIYQKTGMALAVIILAAFFFAPNLGGLDSTAQATIGITLFFLILLVTEALPLPVSCLLTIGLIPTLGVSVGFEGAIIGFAHPVIFFIIASFGIAGGITSVPLTKRILLFLLKKAGNKVENILLAMMIATAVVSFFISNVPACAVMMAIALEFIQLLEDDEQKKSIGKTFMIAIPVATMIGGMATPASSSLNLLAIGLLEQHTGQTISFVHWMAVGIPLVIILIPFAWFLMIKVYKPAQVDPAKIREFTTNLQIKERPKRKEIYVMIIMAIMLTLWIASSWVSGIEIFTVAILGCTMLMILNVLPWKKFLADINWNIIFISGTVLSIAHALVQNGVSDWLAEFLQFSQLNLPASLIIALGATIAFIMLLMITSAPALITVLASPFIMIALANDVNPAFLMIILAFCAGNCYLLPLDTVQLLTYSKGYYRMTDMGRSTIFLQIALIIILAFWLPFMGRLLGM